MSWSDDEPQRRNTDSVEWFRREVKASKGNSRGVTGEHLDARSSVGKAVVLWHACAGQDAHGHPVQTLKHLRLLFLEFRQPFPWVLHGPFMTSFLL